MTVYRIENNKHKGPYAGTNTPWTSHPHMYPHNPSPFDEWEHLKNEAAKSFMENKNRDDHLFGFLSLEDLEDWFDHEEIERLNREGFHVAVYEVSVDSAYIMSRQVAFSQHDSVIIRSLPSSCLYKEYAEYEDA